MEAVRDDRGRPSTGRILAVGAIGGLLAGMMMAIIEMIYGWLADGRTFWDAPMAIWAWVFGLEHFGQPANHVWPIVLGMGAHIMNSIVVQHTRLDSRQAENALLSTIAFASD